MTCIIKHCSQLQSYVFTRSLQKRTVIHAHFAPLAPRPPPRQYEADGTLKRYPTNAVFYDHGISWARWWDQPAGIFHLYYAGEFSEEFGPRVAYREQFRWWAQLIPLLTIGLVAGAMATSLTTVGISPCIYTQDWMEASRERDRAENSYPFTRYLDRRRKERGPHWLYGLHAPQTPNWLWQSEHRDTAFLRAKAMKARKMFLEEESRRQQIRENDLIFEQQNDSE